MWGKKTAPKEEDFCFPPVLQPHSLYRTCRGATASASLLLSSHVPCSSCSVTNGSLWFPASAPEMFSCRDLVRSALSWSLRLPLGLSTLFIPRPPRPQTAKWVELWPVMWSGPGVTGERPESVELTTLLTIKRQPDTASSSFPPLSKAGIANPCPPEERNSTANQPMSQACSQPVCQAGMQESNQSYSLFLTLVPTSLKLLSSSRTLFVFRYFFFHTFFCPIFLP